MSASNYSTRFGARWRIAASSLKIAPTRPISKRLVQQRTEQLRQALGNLEKSYDITLEALGDALDLRDAETEGHSKRVTAYTIAIARAMNIPKEQIDVIARGAFLHDIGKMAIPTIFSASRAPSHPTRSRS